MKVDVEAVHTRICHLLAVIRTPAALPAFVSIEKGAKQEEQRKGSLLVSPYLSFRRAASLHESIVSDVN